MLAVSVGFKFPDGDLMLDLIDEVAVGFERGFAMGGGGQGDYGDVADLQVSDSMDGQGVGDGEFFERFFENSLAFFLGHERVMGVLERGNIPTFMVIAHESLEGNDGSAGGVVHLLSQSDEIDSRFLDGKSIHLRRGA